MLANCAFSLEHANSEAKTLDFGHNEKVLNKIIVLFQQKGLEPQTASKVKEIVIQAYPYQKYLHLESKILADANIMDFAGSQGRGRLKILYEQMLLKGFELSKTNWFDTLILIIESYKISSEYVINIVQHKIEKLKKERKEIENKKNLILQKELKISDVEIKNLKKKLIKTKDRDDRGIQTLFRNTSRNHYTLNRIVDGKAQIMITVNSIILSLIIVSVIGKDFSHFENYISALLFAIANLISITFAIIAITPNRTQGNFTEEEIRSKNGNLLFFGNFRNMHYSDFEWLFCKCLMIKTIYLHL